MKWHVVGMRFLEASAIPRCKDMAVGQTSMGADVGPLLNDGLLLLHRRDTVAQQSHVRNDPRRARVAMGVVPPRPGPGGVINWCPGFGDLGVGLGVSGSSNRTWGVLGVVFLGKAAVPGRVREWVEGPS